MDITCATEKFGKQVRNISTSVGWRRIKEERQLYQMTGCIISQFYLTENLTGFTTPEES